MRLSRLLQYLLYLLTLHSYLLSHVTRLSDSQTDEAVTAAVKDKRETQNDARVTVTLRCRLTVTVTETAMAL